MQKRLVPAATQYTTYITEIACILSSLSFYRKTLSTMLTAITTLKEGAAYYTCELISTSIFLVVK